MSSLGWLILIFFGLCFLVILVYVLVVRAFYWGDKKNRRKSEIFRRCILTAHAIDENRFLFFLETKNRFASLFNSIIFSLVVSALLSMPPVLLYSMPPVLL